MGGGFLLESVQPKRTNQMSIHSIESEGKTTPFTCIDSQNVHAQVGDTQELRKTFFPFSSHVSNSLRECAVAAASSSAA
jgi:hypothetical protein